MPDTITINGNQTKLEDYLLLDSYNSNNLTSKSLHMPTIGPTLTQQQSSTITRMCKSYTDLVSSLKRGSTITLEEQPKSENCDIISPSRNSSHQQFTCTSTISQTSSSTTTATTARPILQQQQRIYNLKYPYRNAQSMFETYDNQTSFQTQLSTGQLTSTMNNAAQQGSNTGGNNYLTTSTNYNLTAHSLASLEFSDQDLDDLNEVSVQTNELQLLINQPVSQQTTAEERSGSSLSTTISTANLTTSTNTTSVLPRPRSPFDQVTGLSSYTTTSSSSRPFTRATSTNIPSSSIAIAPTISTDQSPDSHRSASLVAHETTSILNATTTNAALTSTITITQSPNSQTTQRQQDKQSKSNIDNV